MKNWGAIGTRCGMVVFIAAVMTMLAFPCSAETPSSITIEGQLSKADGSPLTGGRAWQVRFFDAATDGNLLGSALTGTATLSARGVFSLAITPPEAALDTATLFYELAVDTDDPADGNALDDVFPQRVQVNAVPYALRSTEADHVDASGVGAGVVDNNEFAFLDGVTASIQTQLDAKADVADTYTKTEVDTSLADKADVADTYTKTEVDTSLADKADVADTYTKTEVDTSLGDKADVADTYTKTEVDTSLADKADVTDTYTKTEVDTSLADKADVADTYTKTEVDTSLADKADVADTYTKTEVDTSLAGKSDTTHGHNLQNLGGAVTDAQVPDSITLSSSGSVDAGALKSGTVPSARLSLGDSDVPDTISISSSGAVDAGALKSGTVPSARLSLTDSDIPDDITVTEADTLDNVTGRGATTTNAVEVGSITADTGAFGTNTVTIDDDIIVASGGKVGIGTETPTAPLQVSTLLMDQSSSLDDNDFPHYTPLAQSFTAGETGDMVRLDLKLRAASGTAQVTVGIYSGNTPGSGSLLSSLETVNITETTFEVYSIVFSTPAAVTGGQAYHAVITEVSGTFRAATSGGGEGVYEGGTMWRWISAWSMLNALDMYFATYMGSNGDILKLEGLGSVVVDGDGNVGIGTETPAEALDVNGAVLVADTLNPPATTTDRLYNNGGSLYWNGAAIGGSSFDNLTVNADGYVTLTEPTTPLGTTDDRLYRVGDSLYWNGSALFDSANGPTLQQVTDEGATTTNGITAATVDTGQGANELYAMNQNVRTTDGVTFNTVTSGTVDTGQGANELYAMDQDVQTSDAVQFGAASLGSGDTPDQQNTNNSTTFGFGSGMNVAQVFTPEHSGSLVKCTLAMRYQHSTCTVNVSIYSGNTPPSGSLLSSVETVTLTSGSSTEYEVVFATPAPVVAAQQYYILVSPSASIEWDASTNQYSGGTSWADFGSGWAEYSSVDAWFKTFVVPSSDVLSVKGFAYFLDTGTSPSTTANRLYNNGGSLYWGDTILGGSSFDTLTVNADGYMTITEPTTPLGTTDDRLYRVGDSLYWDGSELYGSANAPTLDEVTDAGATTDNAVTVGSITADTGTFGTSSVTITDDIIVADGGSVGLGTNTPSAVLDVAGTVIGDAAVDQQTGTGAGSEESTINVGYKFAQVVVPQATGQLTKVLLQTKIPTSGGMPPTSTPTLDVSIYSGSTPGSGSLLSSVETVEVSQSSLTDTSIEFSTPADVAAGGAIYILIANNSTVKLAIRTEYTNTYTSGLMWYNNGSWASEKSMYDIYFKTWVESAIPRLRVQGDQDVIINSAGQLGIGVSTPSAAIDVNGAINIQDTTSAPASIAGKLYNNGGSLYWGGTAIGGSSFDTLTVNADGYMTITEPTTTLSTTDDRLYRVGDSLYWDGSELYGSANAPTLDEVTDAGATTSNAVTVGSITADTGTFGSSSVTVTDDILMDMGSQIGIGEDTPGAAIDVAATQLDQQTSSGTSFTWGLPNGVSSAQVVVPQLTGSLVKVLLQAKRPTATAGTLDVSIYSGNTPGSGSLLSSVETVTVDQASFTDLNVEFSTPAAVTAGQSIYILIENHSGVAVTARADYSETYPAGNSWHKNSSWADQGTTYDFYFKTWVVGDGLAFRVQGGQNVAIDFAGHLGIGTDTPAEALDVDGAVLVADTTNPPTTTTNRLYNNGGDLYWDGTKLNGGGGTSVDVDTWSCSWNALNTLQNGWTIWSQKAKYAGEIICFQVYSRVASGGTLDLKVNGVSVLASPLALVSDSNEEATLATTSFMEGDVITIIHANATSNQSGVIPVITVEYTH